jgi:thioredoxin-like negative regulator of GroEL
LGICASDQKEFGDLPLTFARPELILSQRGFILFAQDKFVEAQQYFTELLTLLPDNASVMNNVAVCHLYAGNVGQAASFLESFMVSHPQLGAHHPEILFNLTSMYDLTDSSLTKKRALLKVILNGCGDDFDPNCLKL